MFAPDDLALDAFLTQLSYAAAPVLREVLAGQLAEATRSQFRLVASDDFGDVADDLSVLRANGMIELGRVLNDDQVAAARQGLAAAPVHESHVTTAASTPRAFEEVQGRVHYASYAARDVVAAPHLLELANHPSILKLVEGYLGCPPTLYSVNAWWSFPQPERAKYSQSLHRDRDHFRFVTLFVYLTPVSLDLGPHRYVRASHDPRTLAAQLGALGMAAGEIGPLIDVMFAGTGYQNSDQAEALLGRLIHTWQAPAGSALLADTYGLHMGLPPRSGDRLMFWARYGLGPNGSMLDSSDIQGVPDFGQRIGIDPRTRYINRILTGDESIRTDLAAAIAQQVRLKRS